MYLAKKRKFLSLLMVFVMALTLFTGYSRSKAWAEAVEPDRSKEEVKATETGELFTEENTASQGMEAATGSAISVDPPEESGTKEGEPLSTELLKEPEVLGSDSIVLPIASWAGTTLITESIVYADLNAPNDFLNKQAFLTHSSGNPPKVTSTSMGSIGSMEGSYYELSLGAVKYGNLNLSYKMRSSNTGPKNFKILFSTDGVNFNEAGTQSITTAGTFQTFNQSFPEEVGKLTTLLIRIQVADNIAMNGKAIGSGGTNYLNEVSITGSPVITSDLAAMPVISPESEQTLIGQEITITSATEGAEIYYSINDGEFQIYNDAAKPIIGGFPYKITAYAHKDGISNSSMAIKNYAWSQVLNVDASPNGGPVVKDTVLWLSCATEGASILISSDGGSTWNDYKAAEGIVLSELPKTISAKAVKASYKESEVSTFSFTLRENSDYNIYFGQIHSHSDYSDGAGSCEQAFNHAKNETDQIDFLAVTDHSNSFDNASGATILNGSASKEWMEGHQLADKYTDGTFVGIYGYEMTWSNGLGHMNTYNTDGFQSRDQADYKTYSTALSNYYNALKTDTDSISQFNHPGNTFGDFEDFAHYDEVTDQLISLIEVGNGEGAVGSSGYFPSYEYYTRALDKGWHVAPTNNQDNHKGNWGDSNTARTVVLADTLTRENIYDALRNMRVYSTEDNDLQIRYTLNDEIMGTVMTKAPDKVNIKVKLKDPTDTSTQKVDVIVNGGLVVASKEVTSAEEEVNFELPADYSYYYIRVVQKDRDIAVTAPVWTKEVEAVGIRSITTEEALPIKGEQLKITTGLFNNEAENLNIESMEFFVGETLIHKADLTAVGLTSVASGKTADYSFDYLNTTVGNVEVNVIVHASIGGVAKIFRSALKLNYRDPSMVTKVVVDGSHFNDYVTGYYGANFGNFTKIAAQENTKVMIVKDKMTKELLADCDLLIVSAPAKKSGTDNAGPYSVSHFEDEFIELVKNYVKDGGDLIVCGLADYQDTANGQSSTEINKLLTAIAATTRINSDEAYDTVNNGGQAYRLYLTDYNTGSAFTRDIALDQQYSAYSGCTVLLDNDTVVSGKAEYLVKGHPTTYSIDSKSFGGNYSEITKGDAILLAREELSGGNNLYVAGTVFMSNFEVKAAMDNVWDKAYSNGTIMINILKSVKKKLPVTPISDVRIGSKGSIYSVEGTVTAGTLPGNAFFDTIYIQDASGGINIFPVNSGLIEPGQKVRVIGTLDEYLGDLELRVIEVSVIDVAKTPLEPLAVTTKEAMDYDSFGGKLVKLEGKITDAVQKNGIVETIFVKDSSGKTARVFIDGYIGYSSESSKKLESFVKSGNTIRAVGLVSYDTEGARIRVRDRSEIILIKEEKPVTPIPTGTPPPSTGPVTNPSPTPILTPTPTPTPIPLMKDVPLQLEGSKMVVLLSAENNNGCIDATIRVNADELIEKAKKEGGKAKPLQAVFSISNQELTGHMRKGNIRKLNMSIILPDNLLTGGFVELSNIIMDEEFIKAASDQKLDLMIAVRDKSGKMLYSWSFKGKDLAGTKEPKAMNLAIAISWIKDHDTIMKKCYKKDLANFRNGLLAHLYQEADFTVPAKVSFYVGDYLNKESKGGLRKGHKIAFYQYNSDTARLESLPHSSRYGIDKEGYATVNLVNGSDYILLPKVAHRNSVSSLRDRIIVRPLLITLGLKGTNISDILYDLPSTLKLVQSLKSFVPEEPFGAVTVAFCSSNNKVAKVDKNGRVTAAGKGKAFITVKFTLYNGVTKTIRVKVIVK